MPCSPEEETSGELGREKGGKPFSVQGLWDQGKNSHYLFKAPAQDFCRPDQSTAALWKRIIPTQCLWNTSGLHLGLLLRDLGWHYPLDTFALVFTEGRRILCSKEMLRLLHLCHHSYSWSCPLWFSTCVSAGSPCTFQEEGQEFCILLALPLCLEGFLPALLVPLLFPQCQWQAQGGCRSLQQVWHLGMGCLHMPCLENTLNRAGQTKCAFYR